MDYHDKNRIILTIILAVAFGLGGGVVGELVARAYFFENAFNIPLFGEINFSGRTGGGSNVIIRDARKVVVEQDAKILETAAAASASLVGIFERISPATSTKPSPALPFAGAGGSYRLLDELAEGFIITSDGWIISNFLPKELANQPKRATATPSLASRYTVISKDRKIYPVDAIIADPLLKYAFWHVKASDLPVRKFALLGDIANGQTVLGLNWQGQVLVSSIASQTDESGSSVKFSDIMGFNIKLAGAEGEGIFSGFLFNLNGDLIGLYDSAGKIDSIVSLRPLINGLLKNKNIKYPGLGVYYRDLSDWLYPQNGWPDKGALIVKNEDGIAVAKDSAAAKAGLQAGDIITAIDLTEIGPGNGLNVKIGDYLPGDKIILTVQRNGVKKDMEVILGQK